MKMTRRTFTKVSAAGAAGAYVAYKGASLLTGLQTVEAADGGLLQEEFVPTACWIGKQDCGILARRANGRIVKLEGNPAHPRNLGKLCPKGVAQIASLYDPNRIKTPLIRVAGSAKGQPGQWRTASWDEALDLLAGRLSAAIQKDPRLAYIVEGRAGKVGAIYNDAFSKALGIKVHGRRGNDCGGASEDSTLVTWGDRSAVAPDLRNCNYLICYWALTQAGGPGLCQLTYPQEVAKAKERGMKVVSINPYNRPVAHFADEWVPIKPGTDMAFWLAVLHELLADGFVDRPFLTKRTNAASLVDPKTGLFVKRTVKVTKDGKETEIAKELVWDTKSKAAALFDAADISPALERSGGDDLQVNGTAVKTAFELLKEHVASHTPEWAAGVTGVPVEQIKKIARELGENAKIGTTTTVDGVEVPYRPVAYGIHGTATKFHNAIQTNRAIMLTFMVLGAIESAGSAHLWNKKVADPTVNHDKWVKAADKATPDNFELGGSSWFPMGASGYHMMPVTFADPAKYKIPTKPEDMVVLVNFVNPIMTSRPFDQVMEAWKKLGFVAVVTPYLTATADYAGDLVLPCGTLDKWEGLLGGKTLYESADTLRIPLLEPYGESRAEADILLDLTEKMGKLTGAKGFLDEINGVLALKDSFKLPLDKKPTVPEIIDAWTRSKHGITLQELKQRGGVVSKKVAPDKLYLNSGKNPLGGIRGALYVDAFVRIPTLQKKNGVPEGLSRYYSPFPQWTEPVIEQSPPAYDLYLMDFKRMEYKQTRALSNPLLVELAPGNPLVMNASTARSKGLTEGDTVAVESHNPVTGETRTLRTRLTLVEGIRPDTVAITHHVARPGEPSANVLIPFGEGFWDMGGGWYSHVKVRVQKVAGGEV